MMLLHVYVPTDRDFKRFGNRPDGSETVRPVLEPSVAKAGSENRLQVVPLSCAKMKVDSTKDGNRFKMFLEMFVKFF